MKVKNALDFCSFLIANFSVTKISYNNHELKGEKRLHQLAVKQKCQKAVL